MTETPQIGLAISFWDAMARLGPKERALVDKKLPDFLQNPRHPSFKLHRLDRTASKEVWSAYLNKDLRLIVFQQGSLWVLVYVDHHDKAYQWAQTHRVEVHPKTGLIQVYRVVQREVAEVKPARPLLKKDRAYLLALGVPESYLDPLLSLSEEEEDAFTELIEGLPPDVQERLLDLATGKEVALPPASPQVAALEEVLEHPLSRQQILFVRDLKELKQALTYPWEKWLVFLHPSQREAVERTFQGPARVTGAAGTGKTVVVLHRTVTLLRRYPGEPLLLTTFNRGLARHLERSLRLLLEEIPRELTVEHLHALALRWHRDFLGPVRVAEGEEEYRSWVLEACRHLPFPPAFLLSEFRLLDDFGLYTWEAYRSFPRLGRRVALSARQRLELFQAFSRVWERMEHQGILTFSGIVHRVRAAVEAGRIPRFRAVLADEVQDFGPAELMLLRSLAREAKDGLFLALDPGQRIYQMPVSWQALGLDVRGRSIRLRVNYRTTREVMDLAERVLPPGEEEVREVLALLRGPKPVIRGFTRKEAAQQGLLQWLNRLESKGIRPEEVAILARRHDLVQEVMAVLERAGWKAERLDAPGSGKALRAGTVHAAKGLEFRAVALYGANDDLFPLRSLFRENLAEEDRAHLEAQERNLLYVALSRAREEVLVLYWGQPSPFLPQAD